MTTRLRPIAEPFVVARPSGARIRTRLTVGPDDEAVLVALGAHLGFRSWDETWRSAAGRVLWMPGLGQPPVRAASG